MEQSLTDNGKKRRGKPKEFCDVFIITLFIWQTLKGLSYREILAEARQEFGISPALASFKVKANFGTPSRGLDK